MAIARRLPAQLTNCVYVELWLTAGVPRLDLIVHIDARGRALLADPSLAAFDAALRADPVWRRVAAFAREWDTDGALGQHVEGMWLEFDLDPASPSVSMAPRIFVDLAPTGRGSATQVLAHLIGREPARAAAERLRTCTECLPDEATLRYLGVSFASSPPIVRACVSGLSAALPAYLTAVGWPGDSADLESRVLGPFGRAFGAARRHASILHLDVSPRLGLRIGLEYAFARARQRPGRVREAALLDHLLARGWCGAATRDALTEWPGDSVEWLPHEIWHSRVSRRVSHVKCTYATGQPVEVKAYAYFATELLRGGSLLQAPLRFAAEASAPAPRLARGGTPLLSGRAGARSARPAAGTPTTHLVPGPEDTHAAPAGRSFALPLASGGVTMEMSATEQRALEAVLRRSSVDVDFRRQLLTAPHRAIQEAYGVNIPRSFRVKFIERDPNYDALIVLPELEECPGQPASEEDLDCVAGGDGDPPPDPGWATCIGDS